MGLDMYLHKKTRVKNYSFMKEEEKHTLTVKKGGKETPIQSDRVSEVVEEVGYWRKANHIHNWFVENVQNGEDDCKEYWVSEEDLQNLLDLCKKVLEVVEVEKITTKVNTIVDGEVKEVDEEERRITNPEEVANILETKAGFFFGGTEYDEWYLQDTEYTVGVLTNLLAEDNKGADFYYQSSW
jgi:geranylgeranyl pyrophosphate synthase